jgi:hypothetical protein
MADDTLLNVEDDAPVAEIPAVVPVVAAPAEPPAPEPPPDPDEQEAVEIQGGKYVPLPALKAVRGEVKELRTKAAEADSLRQQLATLQGQVAGYQEVQQQLKRQQAPTAPAPQQQDPRALAFAQKLDLYTQDANGQAVPDVAKAASILGIVQEVAGQIADSRVLPMVQNTARERSIANYNWALTVKDPVTGKPLQKELINEVWKSMPIEATAHPEIAKTLGVRGGGDGAHESASRPRTAGWPARRDRRRRRHAAQSPGVVAVGTERRQRAWH